LLPAVLQVSERGRASRGELESKGRTAATRSRPSGVGGVRRASRRKPDVCCRPRRAYASPLPRSPATLLAMNTPTIRLAQPTGAAAIAAIYAPFRPDPV